MRLPSLGIPDAPNIAIRASGAGGKPFPPAPLSASRNRKPALPRWCEGGIHPEPLIEVAERRRIVVPVRASSKPQIDAPRAATPDERCTIVCCACGPLVIRITVAPGRRGPLPDIPAHVERAAGAGPIRVATHRRGRANISFLRIRLCRIPIVAPGLDPPVAAPRRFLPLRLAGQAHRVDQRRSEPATEGACLVPGDPDHRLVRAVEARVVSIGRLDDGLRIIGK
jgi:hypothetical protein